MTKAEREALRALCNDATPGPWNSFNVDDDLSMNVYGVTTSFIEPEFENGPCEECSGSIIALTLFQSPRVVDHESWKWSENAKLIAASREAMPRLLDALDAKDALIAELITITQRAFEMQTDFSDVERFAALKARAGE